MKLDPHAIKYIKIGLKQIKDLTVMLDKRKCQKKAS